MLPNLDEAPYSEALRRRLYDSVVRTVFASDPGGEDGMGSPDSAELAVFRAWGRWFAVWRDRSEDARRLPLSRRWQVVRLAADPSSPDGIVLHEV